MQKLGSSWEKNKGRSRLLNVEECGCSENKCSGKVFCAAQPDKLSRNECLIVNPDSTGTNKHLVSIENQL